MIITSSILKVSRVLSRCITTLIEFDLEVADFSLVQRIPLDKTLEEAVSVISGLGTFGISDDENVELGRLPARELFALLWTLTPELIFPEPRGKGILRHGSESSVPFHGLGVIILSGPPSLA